MSLNLVSPGVKVREVDLTIGRVDAANDQVGAIAGPFEKGPVDVPILIETEQDLLATFGKPTSTDAQYDYWMSASSYLSYGGTLRVLRTDGDDLNNANSGVSADSVTLKIKSYEDYENAYTNATTWRYASKNPGRWANNLKVCTIDGFADQIVSVASTTGVEVGMGVTQSLLGKVLAGSGTTEALDGYLRGVVTGVGTAAGLTAKQFSIKITDRVSAAGVGSAVDYTEGGALKFENPVTTTTTVSTPVASDILGTVDTEFDISITGIATASIQLGDAVTVTGGNSTVSAGTTVIGIGVSTINVDKTITGISTSGDGALFTFSRTTTTTAYQNQLRVVETSGITSVTYTTSTTLSDWYSQQTLGLTNSTVYWKTIAERPGTSQYANERNSKNDEIHVAVVDDTGAVTGSAGNIVEKYTYLSKSKDGKRSPTESVYYKNYLARISNYIYAGAAPSGVGAALTKGSGNAFAVSTGAWGSDAQGVSFAVEGGKTFNLTGGENYSATGGFTPTLANIISSYEVLKNPAEYSINFLINGPSGGSSIQESQAKAKKLIEIADLRKDCIACISPHREGVVNITNTDTQTDNIIAFFDGLNSSSYTIFDSGYKYMYDRFNNEFRYVPCNADVAGLMARASINQFSWFSPAGASRGTINGAVKLAYNPSQAQRDLIYPKRVNPIIASPGAGIILFGDKTALSYASAFDRINVRRLFLTIEDSIERAARAQLFEFNDVITRSNFVNVVEPFLRDVKAKRGITDFIVICDETNNTPDIIDSNQFRADIFVKPAKSINFIGLTFVATRTGVSFEEVVGNV